MRRRSKSWLIALSLFATACSKDEPAPVIDGLDGSSSGAFGERLENDRLKSVVGAWEVKGTVAEFVAANRAELGLIDGVELGPSVSLDGNVETFSLSRDGTDIYGGRVSVHTVEIDSTETVIWVEIDSPKGFDPGSTPESAEQARDAVAAGGRTIDDEPELWWVTPSVFVDGGSDHARLAWRVRATDDASFAREEFWVDAATDDILWAEAGAVRELEIWDAGNALNYSNITGTQSNLIYRGGSLLPGRTPDPEAEAAHTLSELACERMETLYNDTNTCGELQIYVDTGAHETDAFAHCAQWFERNCVQHILGFGPQTLLVPSGRRTLEHELWHSLVARTSKLAKAGEPGAVNEALADVNSFMALRPSGDWVVGTGDPMDPSWDPDRNISDPRATGHPNHRNQFRVGDFDYGFVHVNSVILSHGIWRAVTQGGFASATRDWRAIGYDKMEVLLHRATVQLGSTATLRDAADHLIFQCVKAVLLEELEGDPGSPPHGLGAEDCGSIVNAMAEVGLSAADGDVDGLPDSIDPCPEQPDILQIVRFDPELGCEPTPPEDEPDAGAEEFECDGPQLDCPDTFTASDGIVRTRYGSDRGHCLTPRYDEIVRGSCVYSTSESADDPNKVLFIGEYKPNRTVGNRGCVLESDGRDPEEMRWLFPSAETRAWVRTVSGDPEIEDPARRALGGELLAQFEGLAEPCDSVQCPATLNDPDGSTPIFGPTKKVPQVAYGTTSFTCSYRSSVDAIPVASFGVRWAQEEGESVDCTEAGEHADRIYAPGKQAYVIGNLGVEGTPEGIGRRAFAQSLLNMIVGRALPCN